MVEIIEQNIFNRADFYLGPNFLLLTKSIFSADDVTRIKSENAYKMQNEGQGCHFPDNMKFPDFSRPRLSSTVISRPFRGSGGMLPQRTFKIRVFSLAENEFQTTKFPDFWNSVANSLTFWANSLTFRCLFQIP